MKGYMVGFLVRRPVSTFYLSELGLATIDNRNSSEASELAVASSRRRPIIHVVSLIFCRILSGTGYSIREEGIPGATMLIERRPR